MIEYPVSPDVSTSPLPFSPATKVGNLIFVSGQAYEYAELVHHGVTLSSSPFSSIFYLATGFHGIHVIGGLIAFLMVLMRAYVAEKFTAHEQVSAICVSHKSGRIG